MTMSELQKEQICTERNYNVLVLAMSTLGAYKKTTYENLTGETIKENDKIIGFTQLEPIPKFMLMTDKPVDKVIILETKDSTQPLGTKNVNLIESIQKPEDESAEFTEPENESAVSIFKGNIEKYYGEAGKKIEFEDIEVGDILDSNDVTKAVFETVSAIRKIKEENPNMTLYMDIHGGLREIQILLQAIISLLKIEGINVEKAYTAQIGKINRVDDTLRIFDFVSGINEFINYGRADSLITFMENTFDNSESSDDRNGLRKKIIASIKDIADAISICDMDAFARKLDNLSTAIDEYDDYNPSNNMGGDQYIDIFIDNIKEDYGDLLDKNNNTILKQIAWCLKKGFIQQALTLIESKMPGELCGIQFQGQTAPTKKIIFKNNNALIDVEHLRDLKNEKKLAWKSDENFLFDNLVHKSDIEETVQEIIDGVQTSNRVFKKVELTGDLEENWENRIQLKTIRLILSLQGGNRPRVVNVTLSDDTLPKKHLIQLLRLHKALKDQRNQTNHASSENRATLAQLSDAIAAYVKIAHGLGLQ